MAQYDDDEHALQVSMGAGSIIISVFCHTFRKQPASVAAIVNRCAVCQEHVLIHQIRQCCALPLTVDDPFLQLFF
ncbi:TPA: hypothetical protein HIP13_004831 [Escherichia coli]|nr:hypothetical protein [Escherichia coli]EGQ5632892.1 hypothetical protein [Shigella flexneri]EFF3066546.1 hypothetical protein [Escherichia coli]EFF3665888.1 hypothetical protein [Escherichia coli]EFF9507244.1 hypothetical protein [Escherichia coli]